MGYKAWVSVLPTNAQVVIIGAGFAGAATAWALRRRGISDVIVVEREPQIGRFASGRSAGLGRQLADDDDTSALTVAGARLLRELAPWTPTGGLLGFEDADTAEEYVQRAQRLGVAVEPHSASAIAARWPALRNLRVDRALWVPSDGTIDVAALLQSFTAGVRVITANPVREVTPGARGATVITAHGAVEARVVVDASGAWAGEMTGGPALSAYKRHVFVLEAQVDAAMPWLWHLGTGEVYFRVDGEAVLASPCDASPCQPGHQDPDAAGEAQLRQRLATVAPDLADRPFIRGWACQRAFTDDRRMNIGRDRARPWLVWAAGLGGHGATAAPAVGERAADAVVEALGD